MTIPRLLLEVKLAGLSGVTWDWLDDGSVRCSLGGDEDFVGRGRDGRAALEHLLRRLRVI